MHFCIWIVKYDNKMTINVGVCVLYKNQISLSNLPQGIGDSGQGFVNALLFCLFTIKVREKFKTEVMRLYHCCCCRRHQYTNLDCSTNTSSTDSRTKKKKLPLSENAWVLFYFRLCYNVCKVYFCEWRQNFESKFKVQFASRVRAGKFLTRLALIFGKVSTMICIILVAGHGILLEEEISLQVGW